MQRPKRIRLSLEFSLRVNELTLPTSWSKEIVVVKHRGRSNECSYMVHRNIRNIIEIKQCWSINPRHRNPLRLSVDFLHCCFKDLDCFFNVVIDYDHVEEVTVGFSQHF